MQKYDLFIMACENSADLHGKNLIDNLLLQNPNLKILAIAGPRMRKAKIDVLMKMESFEVMGFSDIVFSLFKLIKNFFFIRNKIFKINPKKCIFIDYPDFNLRLQKSLRKKGYKNKLIHFVAPTVWAWRKKRADFMAKYLDQLITLFPFEKEYFSHTKLKVDYFGHPLADISHLANRSHLKNEALANKNLDTTYKKEYIGIFPGSRKTEILRNFHLQLKVCKRLLKDDNSLKFAISTTFDNLIEDIFKRSDLDKKNFIFFPKEKNNEYMKKMKFALATSGTINLELALNRVYTIVNFAIKPIDLFIIRKILKINLKHYCIVNIILKSSFFKELYGPNLTEDSLYESTKKAIKTVDAKEKEMLFDKLLSLLKKDSSYNKIAKSIISL